MPFLAKDTGTEAKMCPTCKSEMRLRSGTKGQFYGCSNFPNCRKTLPYSAPTEFKPRDLNDIMRGFGMPEGMVLSDQQKLVQEEMIHGTTHLVIDARAGASKTTTLTWTLPLLSPSLKIGFSAFNRHIATELQRKVPPHVKAFTLHSLGFAAIRSAFPGVQVDDDKVSGILDEVLNDDGARRSGLRQAVTRLVGLCKATLVDPKNHAKLDYLADRYDVTIESSGNGLGSAGPDMKVSRDEVFDLVPRVLEINNNRTRVIDMDDMIYLAVALNLGTLEKFDMLLVDEAQDLNHCQQKLVQMACPAGRLVLVGDPFQSIYGFRAADIRSMPNMQKILADTERGVTNLKLTYTRRCPASHVRLAQSIVPDIQATDDAPEGTLEVMADYRAEQSMKAGDMVLCRTNGPLVQTAYALIQRGIPCIIRGRDIGAGLQSLIRALKAVDLPDLTKKVCAWETKEKARLVAANKPGSMITAVSDRSETLQALMAGCNDLSELRARIDSMFSDSEQNGNKVVLSSIHRAKGLESKRVFILRPDLMPHPMAKTDDDVQQERNIMYVAATRSQETMVFCGDIPDAFNYKIEVADGPHEVDHIVASDQAQFFGVSEEDVEVMQEGGIVAPANATEFMTNLRKGRMDLLKSSEPLDQDALLATEANMFAANINDLARGVAMSLVATGAYKRREIVEEEIVVRVNGRDQMEYTYIFTQNGGIKSTNDRSLAYKSQAYEAYAAAMQPIDLSSWVTEITTKVVEQRLKARDAFIESLLDTAEEDEIRELVDKYDQAMLNERFMEKSVKNIMQEGANGK